MTDTSQTSWLDAFKEKVRYFNKHVLNPFTLSFAGRPYSPYAIVQHVGRTSGRTYQTPVVAIPTDEGFVIPLPYGTGVDWFRNVKHAGTCVIASQGEAYLAGEPQVLAPEAALPAFPAWMRGLLEGSETEQYLHLQRLSDTPQPRSVYRAIIADYPIERAIAVVLGALLLFVLLVRLLRGDRR